MSRFGPFWYDADGQPVTQEEAERLLGSERRVAVTQVGSQEVSTVHLVLDHGHGMGGPPLIFETMVFPECEVCVRTPNRHAALAAHDQVVAELRAQLPAARRVAQSALRPCPEEGCRFQGSRVEVEGHLAQEHRPPGQP